MSKFPRHFRWAAFLSLSWAGVFVLFLILFYAVESLLYTGEAWTILRWLLLPVGAFWIVAWCFNVVFLSHPRKPNQEGELTR